MGDWWLANYWSVSPVLAISWVFWVIFSICLHELGHGYMAIKCGDSTPLDRGHMTWNPLVHMGWMSLAVFAVVGMTWGLMPVDPSRFRGKYDDAKVAFAGPLVNLILFAVCAVAAGAWEVFAIAVQDPARGNVEMFLRVGAAVNIFGFLFNLLPVPPLDGSHILGNFVPAFRRLYSTEKGAVVALLVCMAAILVASKHVSSFAFGLSKDVIGQVESVLRQVAPAGTATTP